jgi:hypothetical protein
VLASVLVAHVPPLEHTFFADLFVRCDNEAQRRHNACRVVAALKAIGLDEFVLDWTDIVRPNPTWLTLLAAFLFESLAQYALPKEHLRFSSRLHEPVTRSVKIANPTSHALTYRVRIDGAKGQFGSKSSISVPKRSERTLEVRCTPRFYGREEAVLLLTGTPTGAARGSVLIFRLETDVLPSADAAAAKFEVRCYDLRKVLVPVTNRFAEPATFELSVAAASAELSSALAATVENGSKRAKRRAELARVDTAKPGFADNDRQFLWPDEQRVTLRAGETKRVPCNVCPTRMGPHRVSLLASHPVLGELETVVTGTVAQPKPVETLNWQCDVGDAHVRTVNLPYVNKWKLLACQTIPDALDDEKLTRTLTLAAAKGKLLSEPVDLAVVMQAPAGESANRIPLEVPKHVRLQPGVADKAGTMLATHVTTAALVKYKPSTDMPVRLNPLKVGNYECNVCFTGDDDIRVYRMLIGVNDPNHESESGSKRAPIPALVECTAGEASVETFQVLNEADTAVTFKLGLNVPPAVATVVGGGGGGGGGGGDGPTLTVAPGQIGECTVRFHPPPGPSTELSGSLTFVSELQHTTYQLYIEVGEGYTTPQAVCAGTAELEASVTEAVEMAVTVENALADTVTYACHVTGGNEGELAVSPRFEVEPFATAECTVTFQPLTVGRGAAVLRLEATNSSGQLVAVYTYELTTNATE